MHLFASPLIIIFHVSVVNTGGTIVIRTYHQDFLDKNGDCPTNEFNIELNNQERDTISDIINYLPPIDFGRLDGSNIFTLVELAKRHIPEKIATQLIEFKRNSNNYGTLLIRNLPVDPDLPPTPEDGRISPDKTSYVSEYNLLLMMMYLGEPIAYADEKEGALIQNICPVKGFEDKQENIGSTYLEFHMEDGFHPHKPDYIGLYCLRSDHERTAKTGSASVHRALPYLSSKTISLLRQPFYRIRTSSSFSSNEEEFMYSQLMPVISGDNLEPEMCVDFYTMEAVNSVANLALEILKSSLLRVNMDCVLMPGDLMIVDNRVAAHSRTAFKPRYDGKDRWLQRLFVVQDFRRSRGSRFGGGHICVPLSLEFFSNGAV